MDDFKQVARELETRYAFSRAPPHTWNTDKNEPQIWGGNIEVDSEAFGAVIMGAWRIFCLGGVNRQRCNIIHSAIQIRTMGDWYRNDGREIQTDPSGGRQLRIIPKTTGTNSPISIPHDQAGYSQFHHLPPPIRV